MMLVVALVLSFLVKFNVAEQTVCPVTHNLIQGPPISQLIGKWYLMSKKASPKSRESCGYLSISNEQNGHLSSYTFTRGGIFDLSGQSTVALSGYLTQTSDQTKLVGLNLAKKSPETFDMYYAYADANILILYECDGQASPFIYLRDPSSVPNFLKAVEIARGLDFNELYDVNQIDCPQ